MSGRTRCGLCGRDEPFQAEWYSLPEGSRPDWCWGDPFDCGRAASEREAVLRKDTYDCDDPEHKMLIESCFNLTIRARKAETERDNWRKAYMEIAKP